MTTHEPKKTNEWDSSGLYDIYRVTIRCRDKLCGGMPKNEELIRSWVMAGTKADDEQTDAQTAEALEALVEKTTEKSWNGFPGDKSGLFIWARQVKALFKECASMLRVTTEKRGSKQVFQHGFEVKGTAEDDRIYLGRPKADGYDEGPIHVQTAQGPRTALKRVDYVERPTLVFDLWVLARGRDAARGRDRDPLDAPLRAGERAGRGPLARPRQIRRGGLRQGLEWHELDEGAEDRREEDEEDEGRCGRCRRVTCRTLTSRHDKPFLASSDPSVLTFPAISKGRRDAPCQPVRLSTACPSRATDPATTDRSGPARRTWSYLAKASRLAAPVRPSPSR